MVQRRHAARRRWALIALATALAVAAVAAPTATAHSVLVGTTPANDTLLQESPTEVVLEFNEPVDPSLGSLRVFDGRGEQVDSGGVSQPVDTQLTVGLPSELAPGTYTVAWRVVSDDAHPISGAFVFHVKERGTTAPSVSIDVLSRTSRTVDVLFTASRVLQFAFLLGIVGGLAVIVGVLYSTAWRLRRRLYAVIAAIAGGLALVALANVLFQGAKAVGLSLGDALSWGLFKAVVRTDYGEVMVVQAALAVTVALVAMALRHSGGREHTPLLALGASSVGVLALTPALSGHARVLGGLGLAADFFHVIVAALWTGGLAFLALALHAAGTQRWQLATQVVPRFSNLAVGAVIALIVTGVTSAYFELRTWSALWDNSYGQLLLAKIALVTVLVALGAYNNRVAVPRLAAGMPSAGARRRFVRTVTAELGIMVAVVGVTAVLVSTPPGRVERVAAGESIGGQGAQAPQPFERTVLLPGLDVRLIVDPAVAGQNTITVVVPGVEGVPPPVEVSVAASLPGRDIGPLDYVAEPDPERPGRFVVEDASLSIPDTWVIRLKVLVTEFDLLTETVEVPIGEP